jgi:hypothetical protein
VVTVPAGLNGIYDVVIGNGDNVQTCAATLVGGLRVEKDPTVYIASVDPKYCYVGQYTPISIIADMFGDTFKNTPRVYLNNVQDAISARAVVYIDNITLSAVVPMGLPLGSYDVVVVNPVRYL